MYNKGTAKQNYIGQEDLLWQTIFMFLQAGATLMQAP